MVEGKYWPNQKTGIISRLSTCKRVSPKKYLPYRIHQVFGLQKGTIPSEEAEPAYGAIILTKEEKPKWISLSPSSFIDDAVGEFIQWSQNPKG